MAQDLGVSEGVAGQAVTATAFAALFASLSITALTRGSDRRVVLMFFSALLAASGLITAPAPGFLVLLVGRLSMEASTCQPVRPKKNRPAAKVQPPTECTSDIRMAKMPDAPQVRPSGAAGAKSGL